MKLTTKTLVLFISVLLLTAISIGGVTTYVHYTASVKTHTNRLVELAKSRARIIEAIAKHTIADNVKSANVLEQARRETLNQVISAHQEFAGFGETGEFVLAELRGDNIVFLLKHRHVVEGLPLTIRWQAGLAEPMQAALQGRSGHMVGADYRGEKVIAAFEPVGVLNLGLVAKIDMDEVVAPILEELTHVYVIAFVVVFVGVWVLYMVSLRFFANLEYRESRYQSIISDHPEMICRFKSDGELTFTNKIYAQAFGYTPEEIIGKSVFDIAPQNEHAGLHKMIAKLSPDGSMLEHENMAINSEGELVWTAWKNRGFFDSEGNLIEVQAAGIDVTEQKSQYMRNKGMSQLALDAHEMDEQDLVQTALEWCENLTHSNISFFHFINDDQETIELVAWSRHTLAVYCHVDEIETHYPITSAGIWADAFRNRAPTVINNYAEAQNKQGLPEGHAKLDRLISLPIFDGGKVVALLGVGNKSTNYTKRDIENVQLMADFVWTIASRKRALAKMHELESIVNRSPAVAFVWGASKERSVEYVSGNVTQWGYFPEDFYSRGVNYASLVHEQDLESFQDEWGAGQSQTWAMTTRNYRIVDRYGHVHWVDERSWPIMDEKGNVTKFQGVVLDITERQETEQQLWQLQKAESLGTLAGGIAHDINNLMLPIVALSEMTIDELPEDHRGRLRLEKIHEAGTRAKHLVEKILAFSHKADQQTSSYDLNVVAKEAFDLFRSTVPSTISFVGVLSDQPLVTEGDPTELHTVLINLVSNAVDAIEGTGGEVNVFLERITSDVALETALPKIKRNEDYARIRVKDNGVGMSEEELERIFDPFYTTKEVGKGTGLGLSLVFNVIEKGGGGIKVNTVLGKGTEFEVYLPLVA